MKTNSIITIATAAIICSACQESIEERAAREAREFTEKNCPVQIAEGITADSMTFDKQTLTLHYYMSVKGPADTTAIAETDIRKEMVKSVKGNTNIRPYKDAGFNFMYTYRSTKNSGKILFETNITKKDYNK